MICVFDSRLNYPIKKQRVSGENAEWGSTVNGLGYDTKGNIPELNSDPPGLLDTIGQKPQMDIYEFSEESSASADFSKRRSLRTSRDDSRNSPYCKQVSIRENMFLLQ